MPVYIVRQGDHLASIAHGLGTTPDAVWALEANAELRARRGDGAVLHPGDALHVPAAPEPRKASLRTGADNAFRATIPRTNVTLHLVADGQPLSGEPFRARADGIQAEGTTDGDGKATLEVRVTTRRASLLLARRNQTLVLDANLVITGSGAQRTLTITPAAGQLGSAVITVSVTDSQCGIRTITFQYQVVMGNYKVLMPTIMAFAQPAGAALHHPLAAGRSER